MIRSSGNKAESMASQRSVYHVAAACLAYMYSGRSEPSKKFLSRFVRALINRDYYVPEMGDADKWKRLAAHLYTHVNYDDDGIHRIFTDPTEYKEWLPKVPDRWRFLLGSDLNYIDDELRDTDLMGAY